MGGKARGSKKYVALMRGINVGGKNRLPMAELRAVFEEVGCTNVQTYIQSGNVLFEAGAGARQLPGTVAQIIESRFGYRVPVVLREAAALSALADNNPFLTPGQDTKKLHLMFLADEPDRERAAALDPNRYAPDAFHLRGKEVYLYFPNGTARSKLNTAYFDRALATVGTVRNWNTLNRLIELARQ